MDRKSTDALEIIKGKLYVAFVPDSRVDDPLPTDCVLFKNDKLMIYTSFFADFGPLDLGLTYKFCTQLEEALRRANNADKKVLYRVSDHPHKRSNSVAMLCGFLVFVMDFTVEQAYTAFIGIDPAFIPYRDAGFCINTFPVTVLDCCRAMWRAKSLGHFNYRSFNLATFQTLNKLQNGDVSWIIPDKFIAFSGPVNKRRQISPGVFALSPQEYVPLFKRLGVTCVVRFNSKCYDRNIFLMNGIRHVDLYYEDGGNPTEAILQMFLQVCEAETGAIAVHCKAGLGRTGTNIAAYMMKHYAYTARETMAWCRICRPGSIVGPQQQYLASIEDRMHTEGEAYRLKNPPYPNKNEVRLKPKSRGNTVSKPMNSKSHHHGHGEDGVSQTARNNGDGTVNSKEGRGKPPPLLIISQAGSSGVMSEQSEPLFKYVTKKADLAPNGGSGGVAAGGSSSLARSTDNMRGSLRSQGNDGSGTGGGDRNSRARLLGAATPDAHAMRPSTSGGIVTRGSDPPSERSHRKGGAPEASVGLSKPQRGSPDKGIDHIPRGAYGDIDSAVTQHASAASAAAGGSSVTAPNRPSSGSSKRSASTGRSSGHSYSPSGDHQRSTGNNSGIAAGDRDGDKSGRRGSSRSREREEYSRGSQSKTSWRNAQEVIEISAGSAGGGYGSNNSGGGNTACRAQYGHAATMSNGQELSVKHYSSGADAGTGSGTGGWRAGRSSSTGRPRPSSGIGAGTGAALATRGGSGMFSQHNRPPSGYGTLLRKGSVASSSSSGGAAGAGTVSGRRGSGSGSGTSSGRWESSKLPLTTTVGGYTREGDSGRNRPRSSGGLFPSTSGGGGRNSGDRQGSGKNPTSPYLRKY